MHQKWTLHQIWGHLHSTKQLPNQLHQLTGNCASLHPALIYDAKPCSECRVLDNFPYGSLAWQCHWHFNEIYKLITCTKFQPCSTCDDDDDNLDLIECDQEMIEREFFDVTLAMDDRNKDSVISDLWRDICHSFCWSHNTKVISIWKCGV